MIKKFLPIIFLFAGFQVNATLIDNGSFTTDDIANLDWLDLSATDNMSIADALAANSGWELANKTQYTGLIGQFGMSGDGLLANEGCVDADIVDLDISSGYTRCRKTGNNTFNDNRFFDLFGITGSGTGRRFLFKNALGFYDDAGTRRIGGVETVDRVDRHYLDEIKLHTNSYIDYSDGRQPIGADRSAGQFLVRARNGNVPEPSIIALFAAGLFGIGFARRRKA